MIIMKSGFAIVLPYKRVRQIIIEELNKTMSIKDGIVCLNTQGQSYFETKYYNVIVSRLSGYIKSEVKDWLTYERELQKEKRNGKKRI